MMQKFALSLLLLFFSSVSFAGIISLRQSTNTDVYPYKEGTILNYFKRPTVATSACPVPYGKYTMESGVQYNDFLNKGNGFLYPQTKIRIGLPWRSEVSILLPSEISNSRLKFSGLDSTFLAFKHNITYSDSWNSALRLVYIPSSGSSNYGTNKNSYMLNGILVFNKNNFNITTMLGVASLSDSERNGGRRFNTFNPDILVGWYPKSWLEYFAEIYGQTRTGPRQGPGYNLDTGLLFLINKNIAADVEMGKRLSGQLGNFNTYYGCGISFMF